MTLLLSKPEQVEEVRIHRTLTTAPAGMIQRRNVYRSHYPFLRQWRLGWKVAGANDRDEIVQLFRDTRGSGTFTWIPPGETTEITVNNGSIRIRYNFLGGFICECLSDLNYS